MFEIFLADSIKSDASVNQGVTLYHQYEIIKRGIAVHGNFTAELPE
ncbi:hypothetical protein [Natrinema soli]|nr:hypothetical protein [Natrinema soli]